MQREGSFDSHLMSLADDLIRERDRRKARLDAGLPLHETPEELAERAAADDDRLESQIQAELCKEYRARGFTVWEGLKSKARIQRGHPDLELFHERARWHGYHEVKTPTGALRPDQKEFRRLCIATSVPHWFGGMEVLNQVINAVNIKLTDRRLAPLLELYQPK